LWFINALELSPETDALSMPSQTLDASGPFLSNVLLPQGCFWRVTTFGCAAEFGRYWGAADIKQAVPLTFDGGFGGLDQRGDRRRYTGVHVARLSYRADIAGQGR